MFYPCVSTAWSPQSSNLSRYISCHKSCNLWTGGHRMLSPHREKVRLQSALSVSQKRKGGIIASASTVIHLGLLHEATSVVAQSQGVISKGQHPEAYKGYVLWATYLFCVAQTPVPRLGSHSRCMLSSQNANDRCLPLGLGSGLRWSSSSRGLERSSS